MESLKSDLQVAQEISGLEKPNLIVYGGGTEIQKFCREHGLLYVTDFINAKRSKVLWDEIQAEHVEDCNRVMQPIKALLESLNLW